MKTHSQSSHSQTTSQGAHVGGQADTQSSGKSHSQRTSSGSRRRRPSPRNRIPNPNNPSAVSGAAIRAAASGGGHAIRVGLPNAVVSAQVSALNQGSEPPTQTELGLHNTGVLEKSKASLAAASKAASEKAENDERRLAHERKRAAHEAELKELAEQKRQRLEVAPWNDFQRALAPDYSSPFTGLVDAFQRLLPYHVLLGNEGDSVSQEEWNKETDRLADKYASCFQNIKENWSSLFDKTYEHVGAEDLVLGQSVLTNGDCIEMETVLLQDFMETARKEAEVARKKAAEMEARRMAALLKQQARSAREREAFEKRLNASSASGIAMGGSNQVVQTQTHRGGTVGTGHGSEVRLPSISASCMGNSHRHINPGDHSGSEYPDRQDHRNVASRTRPMQLYGGNNGSSGIQSLNPAPPMSHRNTSGNASGVGMLPGNVSVGQGHAHRIQHGEVRGVVPIANTSTLGTSQQRGVIALQSLRRGGSVPGAGAEIPMLSTPGFPGLNGHRSPHTMGMNQPTKAHLPHAKPFSSGPVQSLAPPNRLAPPNSLGAAVGEKGVAPSNPYDHSRNGEVRWSGAGVPRGNLSTPSSNAAAHAQLSGASSTFGRGGAEKSVEIGSGGKVSNASSTGKILNGSNGNYSVGGVGGEVSILAASRSGVDQTARESEALRSASATAGTVGVEPESGFRVYSRPSGGVQEGGVGQASSAATTVGMGVSDGRNADQAATQSGVENAKVTKAKDGKDVRRMGMGSLLNADGS